MDRYGGQMTMKRLVFALLTILMACASTYALADMAQDITALCTLNHHGRKSGALYDRKYTSYWNSNEERNPALDIHTPEGLQAQYLYICFGDMPNAWAIEEEVGGEWRTLINGSNQYAHTFLDLGGKTHFRLIETSGKTVQFKINEIFIFTAGDVPDWVQRWEPPVDKADILLLVAHPDDELIFFGGTIPTYAVERNASVVIAYMCYSNTTRRSELLNGLWMMGVRNYPIIGTFYDAYTRKLEDAYKKWPIHEAQQFVMSIIRRYKPEVMLTHDISGEYGHGAHKLCADVAQYCVENAANPSVLSESAGLFGVWQVKKLYLHLYGENPIVMNWNVPLSAFGGKTGLEIAQDAYLFHVTQQKTDFTVTDQGETSNALFGLAYSAVGPDIVGGDFMENIPTSSSDFPLPAATDSTPAPVDTQAKSSSAQMPISVQADTLPSEAVPEEEAAPLSDYEPASEAIPEMPFESTQEPMPEHEQTSGNKVFATVAWPANLTAQLDSYGYPVEGETVYMDETQGIWFYASPTLVVRIDRFFDSDAVLTWYEAHIFCDTQKERLGAILYNEENPLKTHVQPKKIAREKQVVFGMNTDYYSYRVGRKTITGMVIRGRKVFYDRVPEANRRQFPNLDTLAMYEDGSWAVYHSDELTAQQYLESGAIDVFSFGPYLVRNGEINPFIEKMTNGKTPQPRCAIGMIEPGHYYAMLAEGRIRNQSVGVGVPFLAQHMYEKGCKEALNLDGGQTAVMTFMGEQITRIGKYNGGKTNPRQTTELIAIGHSDLINLDE